MRGGEEFADALELAVRDVLGDGLVLALAEAQVEQPARDLQVLRDVIGPDAVAGLCRDELQGAVHEIGGGRGRLGRVALRDAEDRAADAGARFLVSPGFHSEVTEYALSKGLLMLPGTATPGEMEQAMALGLDIVKFFPAEQNGGVAKLKALAGPYPNLRWMPTGGINVKNMMDYLSFDRVPFCGGTWMVKKELIQQERWEEITAICREAVKTMLGLELGHIGINDTSPESAERTAEAFAALLGLEHKPGANSDFAGKCVEVLKKPGRGKNGHIAIACSNVDRAEYHLARRGYRFLEETRITDALGTRVIYLDLELGGFAIHLSRK